MNTSTTPDSLSTTPPSWVIVGLCMLFNVIDGMDAMAMAFTASNVSAEWALNSAQIGVLLSASLIGMACGSMLAAPVASRYGQRSLLLCSLLLCAVSMLLCIWSQQMATLILLRALTGLGVGAILVGANVVTYEYAGQQRRGLAIALQSVAFALGATICGLLAHAFNDGAGWRYVFAAGGCITFAAALAGALWLREPQVTPGQKRQHGVARSQNPGTADYRVLFCAPHRQRTASLALAFFLLMFSFYFVMSWTPTLLTQSGFSQRNGITGGILLNIGGMLGALLAGLGANRFGCNRLLAGFLMLNAVLMTLMVPATHLAGTAIIAGFSTGLLLNGAFASLYTLAPQTFAAEIRTQGVGLVVATGRLGALLSPAVAGFLLVAQWTPQGLFTFYAGSQLLAAMLVWRACR